MRNEEDQESPTRFESKHVCIVRALVDLEQAPGGYCARWDGRDTHGRTVASGIYMARLEVGTVAITQKLLLLR